jgi:hypothetical protein
MNDYTPYEFLQYISRESLAAGNGRTRASVVVGSTKLESVWQVFPNATPSGVQEAVVKLCSEKDLLIVHARGDVREAYPSWIVEPTERALGMAGSYCSGTIDGEHVVIFVDRLRVGRWGLWRGTSPGLSVSRDALTPHEARDAVLAALGKQGTTKGFGGLTFSASPRLDVIPSPARSPVRMVERGK